MAWKKIQWSDDAAAVTVRKNSGSNIGTRPRLNFVEGSNITLAISDDAGSDEIDISIAASGGVTDHGALTGLADYDHDQYLRRNGGNTVTGNLLPDATASYRDLGSSAQKWDDVYAQDVRADRIHMAGNLDMNDYKIDDVDDIQAYDTYGIEIRDYLGNIRAQLAYYLGSCHYFYWPLNMSNNNITNVAEIQTESIVKKTTKVDINDIGKLILNDPTELTISGGTVALTQSYHTIDTEGDASTDNLTHITGGTLGQILIISAANYNRTVVVKNDPTQSQNSIMCGTDFSLTSDADTITLFFGGWIWVELSRSDNQA
jgi:hypothetical protein